MNAVLREPALAQLPLRVAFVTELHELKPLAGRWETLARRSCDHDALFFQSYAWIQYVAEVMERVSAGQNRLLIATVWRGTELVGIWPLALHYAAGIRVVRSLDDPFGQFAGAIFANKEEIQSGVAAILADLRSRSDGIRIEGVIAGSALHTALSALGATVVDKQQAVVIDLRSFDSMKSFEQTMNAKTRKNLRNLSNRIRKEHTVEHVIVEDPAQIQTLVAATFDERVEWLHRNGRTSPAFRVSHFRDLVMGLAGREGLKLIAFSFLAGGAVASIEWGFEYDGRYYAYMSAMYPRFAEFSVGRQHMGLIVGACFDKGLKVLELMPPAVSYKTEWGGHLKDIETMALMFNLKGHMISRLSQWTYQSARQVSRMLPEALRARLVRLLNRT